ncbi:hypothetical protein TIFTF001_012416 [Ficus carica]|uniref:TNase-like domain-containing protein n=1 Tax=Ficus carica TaxID=3494 RepID=A0AA88D3N9_FICCA|nr:hypothetical protein TIFTF001_012416 [Ficus carica]
MEPRLLSGTEPTFQVGTGAPPPRGLGTGDAGTAPRVGLIIDHEACLRQPQNRGVAPLAGTYHPSKVNFELVGSLSNTTPTKKKKANNLITFRLETITDWSGVRSSSSAEEKLRSGRAMKVIHSEENPDPVAAFSVVVVVGRRFMSSSEEEDVEPPKEMPTFGQREMCRRWGRGKGFTSWVGGRSALRRRIFRHGSTAIREARRKGNLSAALRDFYGLPHPVQLPDEVKLVLHPLPVIYPNAIQDGDSLTAYVSEENLSSELLNNIEKAKAVSEYEYGMAYALYHVITFGDNIFRKRMFFNGMFYLQCRIRLRGIDAPEYQMPYGDKSKEELTNLVLRKQLTLHFYTIDKYGRFVCDIHCHDTFIQKEMLKKGCAWHYSYYDQRPELAQWEEDARENSVGLWLDPNPENPYEFRMRQKSGSARSISTRHGDSIMPMMNNHLSSTGYYQLNPDSSRRGLLRSTL